MSCETFVSVKKVRAFTMYGALGHGGECTPAKARGPVWETWKPVTHIFLDPVGYIPRRVDLGCHHTSHGWAPARLTGLACCSSSQKRAT